VAYLPKTKVFDGEQYRLHNDYLKKSTADWQASKLRSKNWRVRVVKLVGLWGVYKKR